jgi:hypothetical protein
MAAMNQRIAGLALTAPEVYNVVLSLQQQNDEQANEIKALAARVAAIENELHPPASQVKTVTTFGYAGTPIPPTPL